MKVYGLSDLHVGHAVNRESLLQLGSFPGDWCIIGGDVGESEAHLRFVLDELGQRFERLVWVPGNHELWTTDGLSGVAKYDRMVSVCREYGAITPEDPYVEVPGTGLLLVPLFLLYDYSFCPDGMGPAEAIRWAAEGGILCADEQRLLPVPYPTRQDWCAARLADARQRLGRLPPGTRTLIVNHWPLRQDLCRLFKIPRFTPWCGTRQTEDWHTRYNAEIVVSGHLHMRATDWRDGVRFEEISLGYPRQYDPNRGAPGYLRQVWPAAIAVPPDGTGPVWHR